MASWLIVDLLINARLSLVRWVRAVSNMCLSLSLNIYFLVASEVCVGENEKICGGVVGVMTIASARCGESCRLDGKD